MNRPDDAPTVFLSLAPFVVGCASNQAGAHPTGEGSFRMKGRNEEKAARKGRIRELNNLFREHGIGNGSIMITCGVQALGEEAVVAVMAAVHHFTAFTPDNDPYQEHDFGAIEVLGENVFFKIDYYDLSLEAGSPDPTDEAVTHRVLTIMLANEY